MAGCDFCGKSLEGLPHRCKYCGKVHCSNHILPESHECIGLGKLRKQSYFKPVKHNNYRKSITYPPKIKYESSEQNEMYHPSKGGFNFRFKNPFRNIFSFSLSHEIKNTLTQFIVALFIGLVLNYVYYQNFSIHYLFIGGVQQWFSILIATLNYGLGGGYDLVYLIINGLFYYYLFSTAIKLFYAIITNLNKKGTWWLLAGVAIVVLVIFKYFPNLIY